MTRKLLRSLELLAVIGTLCLRSADAEDTTVLTNATQVRSLTSEQAAKALPVKLEGVFIGEAEPQGMGCVILDKTDGIYLHGPTSLIAELARGDFVQVEGVTDPGGFAPMVVVTNLNKLRSEQVPAPEQVTFSQLIDGGMDAHWIELSGVVRSCEPLPESELPTSSSGQNISGARQNTPRTKLRLASGNERLVVQVNAELNPESYVDAEAQVRGICFNLHNTSRQFLRPLVLVPRGVEVRIKMPPPEDPFKSAPRPIASLLQFDREGNFGHRVHVSGVVTHHQPGRMLWIRDGDRGLRVYSVQDETLHEGDMVDVIGFPIRGTYSPELEDAVFKKGETLSPPLPIRVERMEAAIRHDGDFVELEATLAEKLPTQDGWALMLDWHGARIKASVQLSKSPILPGDWLVGSLIRVAGICSVVAPDTVPLSGVWEPQSFQLFLRSPSDLAVVKPPPWWTPQHVIMLLGVAVIASLLVAGTVLLGARRRLREQEQERAMAEAQFAAVLSERNRMAREIHDTLAQGLAATSVHLRLAKKQANGDPGSAAHHLDAAQQLVRGSLNEARNSIWNMRPQVLENGNLAEALSGILRQMADGTELKTSFEVAGRVRRLAPVFENNLLRVGQEAITNATKHASAAHIHVRLDFRESEFVLKINDDGLGFDVANPPASNGGFGLVGMRERAAELQGTLDINSTAGSGTEIMLTVPLRGEQA